MLAALASGTFMSQAAVNDPMTPLNAKSIIVGNPALADSRVMQYRTPGASSQMRAPEAENVTVKVENCDNYSITFVLAAYMNNGRRGLAGSEDVQPDGTVKLAVPVDKADFLVMLYAKDASDICFLDKADAAISADGCTLTFDAAEATNTVEVTCCAPDGTILTLPVDEDDRTANCEVGDLLNMISYKDTGVALYGDIMLGRKAFGKVKSNFINGPFALTQLIFNATRISGMCNAIVPIDFSSTVAGTDTRNWQTCKTTFSPTPFELHVNELMSQMGATPEDTYTMAYFSILCDKELFGTAGYGSSRLCDSGWNCLWEPVGYTGPFAFAPYSVGGCFGGNDSAILGMPMHRTSEGLRPIGLNAAFERELACTATSTVMDNGNPRFIMDYNGLELGNCAPTLITRAVTSSRFEYSFVGRYGEEFTIDAWNILQNVDPEGVDMFGGQTSSVKVYNDGKLLCDDRGDFGPWSMDWGNEAGKYKVEIETKNVLVDAEIPGYSKGVMEYDGSLGGAPTITSLQLRNASTGAISNKYDKSADAEIDLYAARLTMAFNPELGHAYSPIEEVSAVKAYYAPTGSEEFTELQVANDPSLFFDPGFGHFYSGKLDAVNRQSPDGWFKLRLRVECADGAYQEQEIYPAFYIASLSAGVDQILDSSADQAIKVCGRDIIAPESAEVYTIAGVRVPAQGLTPGIYLVRVDGKTTKVAVR